MRLFVAITLPQETRKRIFEKLCKKIPTNGFKVVGEQNLHITLAFIGETPEELAQELGQRLSSIRFRPFKARLAGIGTLMARLFGLA